MKHMNRKDIPGYKASGDERLAHLADYLDGLPAGVLTFTRWYGHGRGCAVGLAAHESPWMQAQGLSLADTPSARNSHPVYAGKSDWPAVADFFEISLEAARDLFSTSGYGGEVRPHPREVAARIRAFVRARGELAVPA